MSLITELYWWIDEKFGVRWLCALGIHKRYKMDMARAGDRKGKCIRCDNWNVPWHRRVMRWVKGLNLPHTPNGRSPR